MSKKNKIEVKNVISGQKRTTRRNNMKEEGFYQFKNMMIRNLLKQKYEKSTDKAKKKQKIS